MSRATTGLKTAPVNNALAMFTVNSAALHTACLTETLSYYVQVYRSRNSYIGLQSICHSEKEDQRDSKQHATP